MRFKPLAAHKRHGTTAGAVCIGQWGLPCAAAGDVHYQGSEPRRYLRRALRDGARVRPCGRWRAPRSYAADWEHVLCLDRLRVPRMREHGIWGAVNLPRVPC